MILGHPFGRNRQHNLTFWLGAPVSKRFIFMMKVTKLVGSQLFLLMREDDDLETRQLHPAYYYAFFLVA